MRGSIMNYRTFFMEEPALVYARASRNVVLLEITFDELSKFNKESAQYERKLLAHQMKILNMGKNYPLDYIRRVHEDFMTPLERDTLPEVAERSSLMKLMGMIIQYFMCF